MGPLDFSIHLANFAAPALFLALLLASLGPFLMRKRPTGLVVWAQAAINLIAGLTVLAAGLWYFGRDGKLATYVALVIVTATSQWIGSRAWR
jgi:hypothetical protein